MSGTWSAGWATNDIVTAAEFAKGAGCIYDTTLGAGAASIDVTGIVGVYAHLKIEAYLRSDSAVVGVDVLIRFNNDSAANYGYIGNGFTAGGAASGPNSVVGTSLTTTLLSVAAASATAQVFSPLEVVIPHYAGSANFKAVNYRVGNPVATGAVFTGAGTWRNAAAINRVTISLSAGNIIAGSRLSIYAFGS